MGTPHPVQPIDLSVMYSQHHDLSQLDSAFTASEVHRAVSQLASNKASGPDGLPNEFIKLKWNLIQPHVMSIFHQFAAGQTDLLPVNEATIILVPKTDTPNLLTDYRPISLINLLPKLLSKVIANRLKPLMPDLVSDHQTAFVQGRFIAENFLATREVIHHVHRSRSPSLLLKLDFTKAFDTLDWSFLFNVLATRGFPQRFISWISALLSTSTSRIQVNGCLSPAFSHNRGLRQGDPISPYLFILGVDVLQQMTAALSSVVPHCLTARIRKPVITFQYADDTMLVISADADTVRKLLLVLHCFTASSGLTINFSKSLFIPLSVPEHNLHAIERILGCKRQPLPITYLGMPLSLKQPRREDLMPIVHKLERRLAGWKARFISRAGKLQLVKSVLSSIPTYFLSCFSFPKWLLQRIDVLRRQFLWSKSQSTNPIHLLNWHTVCLPLRNGGLGVPNLYLQNISLLLRWWWRLYTSDGTLWKTYAAQIYSLRLNSTGPLLLSPNGSFFWRSINRLKPIFHSSISYQINSGEQTSFWYDAWAGQPLLSTKAPPITQRTISVCHAKPIFLRLIPSPLTTQQHAAHQRLQSLTLTAANDVITWRLSASGQFTVRSIYRVLSQGGRTSIRFGAIWRAKVPPSAILFFFFLIHNRLLTHEVMQRRHLFYTPGCVLCMRHHPESAMHLFFHCPYAAAVWDALSVASRVRMLKIDQTPLLTYLASVPVNRDTRPSWLVTFILATSFIWRERNDRIFREKSTVHTVLIHRILQEVALCLKHC